jgi:outer membrane receptor protein involved in Fe transport
MLAIRTTRNPRVLAFVRTACAAALSIGGASRPAWSQDAPNASSAPAPALEEITVTGSRIKRVNDFNTPTPTTVIDSSSMESSGIVNIGQALTETPANVSTFTPAATGNANFFTGSYISDIRGLNPYFGSRTLTLVNTRRFVQTDQGDSVDLNFIPQILVQRVDVVTGGASAAYGSGAIAGVENILLDTKLEGGRLNGDFYQTSHSDGRDRHLGAAYGHGLFDDRVHFVIGAEMEKQDSVGCYDARSWCHNGAGLYQNGSGGYNVGTHLRANQISSTGVFLLQGNGTAAESYTLQATPDGTATMPFGLGQQPYSTNPFSYANTVPGGEGTPIYRYTNLMAPVDRGVASGTLTAQLTDTIKMTADANWGKVQTTNDTQALTSTNLYISPENAFIQKDPALVSSVGNGAYINKDWTSQVNSYTQFTTEVKRFSVGFDGKLAGSWTWDAYYQYGLTQRDQLVQDNRHSETYLMAIDSVIDPQTGQPACYVTLHGLNPADPHEQFAGYAGANASLAQGCVPINPFGNQTLSQAAHGYSFGMLDERLRYEQTVAAFNTSGELFDGIGAGPFTAAAGFEWRQEVGHNDEASGISDVLRTDYLIQYGEPFGGAVTVNEAYLEANLPVAKDLPFAHLIEFDVAGRESRYDNKALYGIDASGQEFKHDLTTWKLSGLWEPIEGVRLRGSQSRDARAANFRELYYGQIISAGGAFGYCGTGANYYADPCTYHLEGNVNLRPETSDTTTIGIVLTPQSILTGMQFSADYFRIKIHNAIEQASTTLVTTGCRAGVQAYCNELVFNPNSGGLAAFQGGADNIQTITATSFNGASYAVKGIDFSLNYLQELPHGATLNSRLLSTFMNTQTFQAYPGGPTYNILGQTGTGNSFLNDYTADAKWRGTLMTTYTQGQWSTTPSMSFVGHGIRDYLGVTPNDPNYANAAKLGLHQLPNNSIGSYFLFNLNVTYRIVGIPSINDLQLYTQVNNVLNRRPPLAVGASAFGAANNSGGTNPIFYDTMGLAFRVGFRLSF